MLRWSIAVLLFCAPFFLALGLTLPLVRFEKLFVFSETPSLMAILGSLWSDGNWPLAVVVALFSILFPIIKMITVAGEALAPGKSRASGLLSVLSKWSMMDVLLVALVIFAAKTSGLATAITQPGLWFYAASTVAAGLAHALIAKGKRKG